MTNNGWVNFASSLKTTESTFAQPISGTSLGQGTHEEVVITGVEPGSNPEYPSIKITWEKDGATRNDSIFFLNYEKDGPSNQYLSLATALCGDITLRQRFFRDLASADGSLFNNLVSMKANIVVGHKKVREFDKKFKIVNLNGEQYQIVDAFDDKTVPEGIETAYGTYQEAKSAAEENGLQLSYLNVLRILPVKDKELLQQQTDKFAALVSEAEAPKPKASGSTF
jgi:hypothetical protein